MHLIITDLCNCNELAQSEQLTAAERGYEVHLIVDGVTSQYLTDRAIGLQVLSHPHAVVSPVCAATECHYQVLELMAAWHLQ